MLVALALFACVTPPATVTGDAAFPVASASWWQSAEVDALWLAETPELCASTLREGDRYLRIDGLDAFEVGAQELDGDDAWYLPHAWLGAVRATGVGSVGVVEPVDLDEQALGTGTVDVSRFEEDGTLTGTLVGTLADGTAVAASFTAAYCVPSAGD